MYTIIIYETQEFKGKMIINNYKIDKKGDKISNKKYVDKVMNKLSKIKNITLSCYKSDSTELGGDD